MMMVFDEKIKTAEFPGEDLKQKVTNFNRL
jgi:hypothetical protein